MSAASTAAAGRRAAQRQMTVILAAYRPGGTTTDADGMEVPDWQPQGTTIARIAGQSAVETQRPREVVVGGVSRPVMRDAVHIPLDATVPKVGWEYVVIGVSGGADSALLGRRYHVVNVPAKAFATARRLAVVEV